MKKLKLYFGCLIVFVMLSQNAQGKGCTLSYIITGDTVYCSGDAINLTFQVSHNCSGVTGFNWYKSGTLITTNHTGILVITDTGTYVGHAIISGFMSGDVTDHPRTVKVRYLPATPPAYTITGSNHLCTGVSTTYSVPAVANGYYTWSLPAGWAGSSNLRTISVTPTSSGTVSVMINTDCMAFAATPLAVTVDNPMPTVTQPIAGNTTVCVGLASTYSIAPITNATSYSWSLLGWPVTGSASTNIVTATPTATSGAITVRGYNACGSSNVVSLGVTANTLYTPTVSIAASGTTICAGTDVMITATAVNGGSAAMFNWLKNGISVLNSSVATYHSNSFANGDVITCVMSPNNICQTATTVNSNSVTILVSSGVPSVTISTPTATICSGASVVFTASPVLGGTVPMYNWYKNGVSVQNSSSATYSSAGIINNDSIKCVMTSNETCVSTATANSNVIGMTVNAPVTPSVSISPSANNVCYGTTVIFTATATNGGTSPTYNFLINGSSYQNTTSNIFSHVYYLGGPVTCIITSNQACITTTTATSNAVTMVVSSYETVSEYLSITSGSTLQCAGNPITVTANITYSSTYAGTPVVYQWKVNGINVGTNSPAYTTTSSANGDLISCTISYTTSCGTAVTYSSGSIIMSVYSTTLTPTVSISQTTGTNPECAGSSATFTAVGAYGGATPNYQWKVDGVNAGTNSSTFTTTTLTNGQVVTCILTSSFSCASPATVTSNAITMIVSSITLTPSISIAITSGSNSICSGNIVTFAATIVNGGTSPSYQWKINGINVGTNSPTFSFLFGIYSNVTCVLTSNITCPSTATSNSIAVTVNYAYTPVVTISMVSGTNTICSGDLANFTATTGNAGTTPTYQWKVDGVNYSGATGSTFTTNSLINGQMVTCMITSSMTCSALPTASSNGIAMTVNGSSASPIVTIVQTSGTNPECAGSSATFTATATYGVSTPAYQWKINGVNAGTNSPTFTTATLTNGQVITCILTSNASCLSTPTATSAGITMVVNPLIIPSVSIALTSGTNPKCTGASSTFTATPVNGGSTPVYQWKLGTTLVGTNSPTYTSTTITNGQVVTCMMTSNAACLSASTVTSAGITMTVSPTTITTPGVITGALYGLCPVGISSSNYTIAPVANATSYNWTPPTGATIASGQGTTAVTVSFGSTFVSGNLSVTAVNACVTSAARILVLKSIAAAPTVLTGPSAGLCPTGIANATYTTTAVAGATAYTWAVPTGVTIISGQGTTALNVNFESTFTTGNITVATTNACGNSAVKTLALKSVLAQAGAITGITTGLCPAGVASAAYTIVAVAGATSYLWTVPTGATITGGQGTTAVTVGFGSSFVTGNISVMAVNACGNSPARALTVKALLATPASISGLTNICGTTSATYTTPAILGATGYNWIVPTGMTIASGQGTTGIATTFAGTAMAAGSLKVASVNACGMSTYKTLGIAACASPIPMGNPVEEEKDFTTEIYPNPATNELGIRSEKLGIREVKIYDMIGREILNPTRAGQNDKSVTIDISGIAKGIYFIEIQMEKGLLRKKIIKE